MYIEFTTLTWVCLMQSLRVCFCFFTFGILMAVGLPIGIASTPREHNQPTNSDDVSKAVQDKMRTTWNSTASSMVTFYCKAKIYIVTFPVGQGPTLLELESWLKDFDGTGKWLDGLQNQISKSPSAQKGYWGNSVECFRDGLKQKNTYFKLNTTLPESEWIFDGQTSMRLMHASREIDIEEGRNSIELYREQDFSIIPPQRILENSSVSIASDSTIQWVSPQITLRAEPATGFVNSLQAKDKSQEVRVFKKQASPIHDNPLFGKVVCDAAFNQGRTIRLTCFLVSDIRLNSEIPESTFQFQAVPGDRVVDFRKDRTRPQIAFAKIPYSNVITLADEKRIATGQTNPPVDSGNKTLLLILACIVFFSVTLLIVTLLRKRARSFTNP